jgi:hypothetical protein
MDGKPVPGVSVVAVSDNGSDSLQAMTGEDGGYILNIRPDTMYNITAYSKGLNHTIFPVYLHSTGISGLGKDVADKYDITLTTAHNSTIAGTTIPGWLLVDASPIDGGASFTAVSNYTGQYSIGVKPGIEYSLSATDYYGQLRIMQVDFYYRNGYTRNGDSDTVTVGQDETVLVDMITYYSP